MNFVSRFYKTGPRAQNSHIDAVIEFLNTCENAKTRWDIALPLENKRLKTLFSRTDVAIGAIRTYAPSRGTSILHDAIRSSLKNQHVPSGDETGIIVSDSSFEILQDIYNKLLPEVKKQGLLLPVPSFGYYQKHALENGVNCHLMPHPSRADLKYMPEELDRALSESHAKLLIWNNPVNPTGMVYTQQETDALAKIIAKHDVMVIADEAFKDIVFGQNKSGSFSASSALQGKIITLRGLGKTYGAPGLRISYAFGDRTLISPIHNSIAGPSHKDCTLAAKALQDKQSHDRYVKQACQHYRQNWERIKQHFAGKGDGVECYLAEGTNMCLVSFPGVHRYRYNGTALNSGIDLAKAILQETGIAVVPGEGFFMPPERMAIRLPLWPTPEELTAGLERISHVMDRLQAPDRLPVIPKTGNKQRDIRR